MQSMNEAIIAITKFILVDGLKSYYHPANDYHFVTDSESKVIAVRNNKDFSTTFYDVTPNLIGLVDAYNYLLYGKARKAK